MVLYQSEKLLLNKENNRIKKQPTRLGVPVILATEEVES
jgi:hypothetical protein